MSGGTTINIQYHSMSSSDLNAPIKSAIEDGLQGTGQSSSTLKLKVTPFISLLKYISRGAKDATQQPLLTSPTMMSTSHQ